MVSKAVDQYGNVADYSEFVRLWQRACLIVPEVFLRLQVYNGDRKPHALQLLSLVLPEGGESKIGLNPPVSQLNFDWKDGAYSFLPDKVASLIYKGEIDATTSQRYFSKVCQKIANILGMKVIIVIDLEMGFFAEYGDYAQRTYTFMPRRWWEIWKFPTV